MISLLLFFLSVFCLIYYGLVIVNAGTKASFVNFWPLCGMGLAFIAVFIQTGFYTGLPHLIHLIIRIIVLLILAFFLSILCIILMKKSETGVDADYIIVPGANVKGEKPSKALQARIDASYEYLASHKKCSAILSGYQNPRATITQGKCMQQELKKRGIEGYRLLVEPYARTTQENLKFAKDYMMMDDPVVIVLTGKYHLARCLKEGKKQRYRKLHGIGVGSDPVLAIHYYMRETFAYIKHLI